LVRGAHPAISHAGEYDRRVVITFTDITASKKLEAELRAAGMRLREMLDEKK